MIPIDFVYDIEHIEKEFGGLTHLCRDLVENKVHPNSTVTLMRGETIALTTDNIYETARWIPDGDHFRKFRPNINGRKGST